MVVDANKTLENTVAVLHNGDAAAEFLEMAKKVLASLMAINVLAARDDTIDDGESNTQIIQDSLMTVLDWLITMTDDGESE